MMNAFSRLTVIALVGCVAMNLSPAMALDAIGQHAADALDIAPVDTHQGELVHEVDLHGDAHHDAPEGGLPQLDVRWYPSQMFWLAVMFFAMYIPFRFKVLPDLSGIIERRREQVEGDLMAARNLKQEAENVHKAYETIVKEARDQSSALFVRAEEKIKALEKEGYNEFFQKASKEIAAAEAEIDKAKASAMGTVNDIAAEVASVAAEKLVGIKTDKNKAISVIETIGKKKAA